VRALASDEAVALLARHTRGALRYRIAWAAGGKRRAVVWRAAGAIAAKRPELVNDPTESPWQAVVHEGRAAVAVELVPSFVDPRFTYRLGDVPAASHPTVAAALVRIAGVREGDVVWDPFVGSGTELCERVLAGPYRRLIGSDREPLALEVARKNLEAVGAHDVEFARGDALHYAPSSPTLIITNPPMGRRVLRGVDLGAVLEQFVEHAAKVLAPGGRLVWISPLPDRTVRAAQRAGLTSTLRREIDMGGFAAELQVFSAKRR
jgi:23S rRNA G2445 N2-methylase RlmL